MICRTTKDFQNEVLKNISFSSYKKEHCNLYTNKEKPELGYFVKYGRENYYDFVIGDYSIPNDFSLCFNHSEDLIRFGTVYTGETNFEIENSPVSSFSPSSFLVIENGLKGRQTWNKGQHFHGAEITIYKKYFENVIHEIMPEILDNNNFISNYTYHYLPLEISSIIQSLRSMAEKDLLTPLYLESKILECIALLHKEVTAYPENAFTNQINHGEITIGTDRTIKLTASDINAIQKAHDILTKEACNPPTIKSLSKTVFLNEQKLKAGFHLKYHMSIGQYTTSLRMNMAQNLLSTTEMSIAEIAKAVGYNYSGNFVKMFKKVYGKTPLVFRKMKF